MSRPAPAPAMAAPDAATFDDSIDYPLAVPATMGRAIAISMLRGSVNTFAQRHRFVRELQGDPAATAAGRGVSGGLQDFAGDVYRFARTKGFNREEAAEVRRGIEEKYGGLEVHRAAVAAPAAAVATPADDATRATEGGKKKRKRSSEADSGTLTKKSKKRRATVDGGEDDARREKKRKASKKTKPVEVHVVSSSPELLPDEDAGRRSRSTSLGELGPNVAAAEQAAARPKKFSKRNRTEKEAEVEAPQLRDDAAPDLSDGGQTSNLPSNAHRQGRDVSADEGSDQNDESDDGPIPSRSKNDEAEADDSVFDGDESGPDERPTFTADTTNGDVEVSPPYDGDSSDEIIIPEEEDESDADAVEDDAAAQSGSPSPTMDSDALEARDQRPSFAVEWGSPVPDQLDLNGPLEDLKGLTSGEDSEASAAVPLPESDSDGVAPADGADEPSEQRIALDLPEMRQRSSSPSRKGSLDSIKKRKRRRDRRNRASSPFPAPSSDTVDPLPKALGDSGVNALEQGSKRRKLLRFTVGGSASNSQALPRPVAQEVSVQDLEPARKTRKDRRAEKKAKKRESKGARKAERRPPQATGAGDGVQYSGDEEPMPKDLESAFPSTKETRPAQSSTTSQEKVIMTTIETKAASPDEPMPKDLERIFMNLTETQPESPPRRQYCDMAVQTSPRILPIAAPEPATIVSQDSNRSRPSQQPSPTETQSSASLKQASFERRTPALTYSKKRASAGRHTPATSFTSADALAQGLEGRSSSMKVSTGKLKRIKQVKPAAQHTFELATSVKRHRPHRSADYSIAETESIASPSKTADREVPETLEVEPRSSPELGLSNSPPDNYLLDEDSASIILGDDAEQGAHAKHVEDSQPVVPESYAHYSAINSRPERSQMGVGIFDQADRVLSTFSEEPVNGSSDEDSDDDIPHHVGEGRVHSANDGDMPAEKPIAEEASDTELESEQEVDPAVMEPPPATSATTTPGTDDMQDLINSQLQEEIAFEVSQRRSQERTSTPVRGSAGMATTVARRTDGTSPRRKTGTSSEHFAPSPRPKPVREPKSGLPFPSIEDRTFGLFQERYAAEPFKLLVATMFVNQTPGKRAIPVVEQLFEVFPSPAAFASADAETLEDMIKHLGLGEQRADRLIKMAKTWVSRTPRVGTRLRVKEKDYPTIEHARAAKIAKVELVEEDADDCGAYLEIAHLPGCGRYAFDSWRIFCRDVFRGVADGWDGEGVPEPDADEAAFQPEWMRVVPSDKELRAYLRWMWLKEGFAWDWHTGDKKVADQNLIRLARQGGPRVEIRIAQMFKGSRKSRGLDRDDDESAGTSEARDTPVAAPAALLKADTIRRAFESAFVDDDIEDEEMTDVHPGPQGRLSESVRLPSTPPLRRTGTGGRAAPEWERSR